MTILLLHLASAIFGVTVAALLVVKLTMFPEQFKRIERIGMGLVGGTMILRIGPIVSSPETTPFSDWSTTLMTFGLVLMHWGRLARLIRHARIGTLAKDAAEAHLRARGKM